MSAVRESVSVSSQGREPRPGPTCRHLCELASDFRPLLLVTWNSSMCYRTKVFGELPICFHSVKTIKNSYSGVLCLLVYSLLLSLQASEVAATKASRGRSKGSLIIECEICAKRFRYQSDMKNHYESHFRTPARR